MRSARAAKKRADARLPEWGKAQRSPFCAVCGANKENKDSGYCNKCKRDNASRNRIEAKKTNPNFAEEERISKRERYRNNEFHRLQVMCRLWVRRSIKAGHMKKQVCEVCGEIKVDAHHDDYAKPLDVRWLCRSHHREHHERNKHLTKEEYLI